MSDADRIGLTESWKAVLLGEFQASYMRRLREFLLAEKRARKIVYPKGGDIFAALNATPLEQVKVVIIGQDPYHGPGQAHGLCFSVPPGVAAPPSLVNIFQEINTDMADDDVPAGRTGGSVPGGRGCLAPWARQGVLLLNSVLTVVQHRAGSHRGQGWETLHRPHRRGGEPGAGERGVPALGRVRQAQGRAGEPLATSGADGAASFAALGQWLLRLPAFLAGESLSGGAWRDADQLV